MDRGVTYGTSLHHRVSLYLPPEFEAPDTLQLTFEDQPVTFYRLSDRSLECEWYEAGTKRKTCGSADCHRRELGVCQCGAHPKPDYRRETKRKP